MPLFRTLNVRTPAGETAQINLVLVASDLDGGDVVVNTAAPHSLFVPSGIAPRFVVAAADVNVAYGIADLDIWVLPNGVWTASRNITLLHAGATAFASVIEVINYDQLHVIDVVDPSFGVIDTVAVSPDASNTISRRYVYNGTTWQILH